jgi:hypothetical protein
VADAQLPNLAALGLKLMANLKMDNQEDLTKEGS